MSEQEGETVLLDKLAGSPLDYVEDEDAPDGALRLREDLLDKRLMMTARFQHKMVDNLAGGQEHRAQAQEFVQSMIDEFRVEVILERDFVAASLIAPLAQEFCCSAAPCPFSTRRFSGTGAEASNPASSPAR
jgi:hypothetical protein